MKIEALRIPDFGLGNESTEKQILDLLCSDVITPYGHTGYLDFFETADDLVNYPHRNIVYGIILEEKVRSCLWAQISSVNYDQLHIPFMDIKYVATSTFYRQKGYAANLIKSLIEDFPDIGVFTTHAWKVDLAVSERFPSGYGYFLNDWYLNLQLILRRKKAIFDETIKNKLSQIVHAHDLHTNLGFRLVKSVSGQRLWFNYIRSNYDINNIFGVTDDLKGVETINNLRKTLD